MTQVEAEVANLRAALTWLADTDRSEDFQRLAGAILWPWYLTGQLREGRAWAERALAAAPDEPSAARSSALFAAGHLAHYLGDDDAAVSRLTEAADLARRVGDLWQEAFSTLLLGIVAEDAGDYERAAPLFHVAREQYARAGHPRGAAIATFHLGVVAYGRSDPDRATAFQEEALAAARAETDPLVEAWCQEWLAVLAADRGDLDGAATALDGRLTIGIGSRSMPRDGQLMATVAVVGQAAGAHQAAARLLGATEALLETSGERVQLPERTVYERAARRLRSALGPRQYARFFAQGRSIPDEAISADMRTILDAASGHAAPPPPSAASTLTPREVEVLRLMAQGLTNAQIGERLFVSPRTVNAHLTAVFRKLDVSSRAAATRYAIEHGLG